MIFSGYNIRAVIAFIRTLEKNNIDYFILAKSDDDEIFDTQYYSKVVYVRKKISLDQEDLYQGIITIKNISTYDEFLIAPSTEALNRYLINNRSFFESIGCIIPIVDKAKYEQISDKYSFGELCKNNNIETPCEYNTLLKKYLPLVLKPKRYFSKDNRIFDPKIITNEEELEKFKREYDLSDFYIQEYVDGRSVYLLYYFNSQSEVFKLSQENFIQQENGKSMIYAKVSNFHNNKISKKFESLFKDLNFRGLVMVELKVKDDRFIMIEANPRFWGPSQLFVDADYNFFEFLLSDYGFSFKNSINKDVLSDVFYFWNDGIVENVDERKNIAFYNFSKEEFLKERNNLKDNEIFNREDTKKLCKGTK